MFIPKFQNFYIMENITIEEVMENLDMFQAIFGKVYAFSLWDTDINKTDAGTPIISEEF